MRFNRRRRTPPPASPPRLLAHVVHYFGDESDFAGRSTTAEADDRRRKVTRVLDALRSLPYRTDVLTCGLPDSSLVPIDRDLSDRASDPRHLVYAAIEAMREDISNYDYFLCLEDDILVTAETIDRMVRFTDRAQVNEILLPNRIERTQDGTTTYCVDLLAMPGWSRLSRRFEGSRLGVAINPHSGLTLLSRRQLRYAAHRVDLGRRDLIVGGEMASAFANVHEPFLLWRTRDEHVHHVEHLDRWIPPTARVELPASKVELEPVTTQGSVDEIRLDGAAVRVRGWLADGSGSPVALTTVVLDGTPVPHARFETELRPDVRNAFPTIETECGFVATFSLFDVPAGRVVADKVELRADGVAIGAAWPSGASAWSFSNAPQIPDAPFMPDRVVERISDLFATSHCYLEYGTGGTTALAATRQVPVVHCVESDASWLAAVAHKVAGIETSSRFELHHADIGPTGPWGYPTTAPGAASADYALAVWDQMEADGVVPDLVLVDGRFRVACFLASLLRGRHGSRILFDDYGDRPHYAAVEEVVLPEQWHDRTAEFVVPDSFDRDRAWQLLVHNAADAR